MRLNQLAGPIKIQEPFLHCRAVMRIAGKPILDDFYLLICSVLERKGIGAGVDEAFDGFIVVEVYIYLAQKAQFSSRLGESENGDRISVDVAQPPYVGFGLDLKKRLRDMHIVTFARP